MRNRRKPAFWLALALACALPACAGVTGPDDPGGRAPRALATWNLRQFPQSGQTVSRVAGLIDQLELDLVAIQEVTDIGAFDDLVDELDGYGGSIQGNGSLLTGIIWHRDAFRVQEINILYASDNYVFPREPVQVRLERRDSGEDMTAIVVHLKAGTSNEDEDRRVQAAVRLAPHIEDLVSDGEQEVVILGDFNETESDPRASEVFGPFTGGAPPLDHLTQGLPASDATFLPSGVTLDHALVTPSLSTWVTQVDVPDLDAQMIDYESTVSDHLPVVLELD